LDGVGQGLLAVGVLAQLQGRQGGEGVGVLGGADDDGVEVAGPVVQLAEVGVALSPREALGGPVQVPLVDVDQGDDLLAGDLLEVVAAAPADPDRRDAQLLQRRARRGGGADAGHPVAQAGQGGGLQGLTAGDESVHRLFLSGQEVVEPVTTSRQNDGTSAQADWYVASSGTGTYTSGVRNSGISGSGSPTALGSMNASRHGPPT